VSGLPPFDLEEVHALLARMRDVVSDRHVVLVGGQALAFWAAQIAPYDATAAAAISSSVDIDFQARPSDARRAAAQLDVEVRIPTIDEPSVHTGLVRFLDRRGVTRTLDFIECPHGLEASDVRDTALKVLLPGTEERPVSFWVMHPERCLRSRIYNADLPGKRTPLAITQMRAAVAIVRAFGVAQLEAGVSEKVVRAVNEAVFDLAYHDRRSHRALVDFGVDVMTALTTDARLHEAHLRVRVPQMRRLVNERRARWDALIREAE
jgi:hypothetical protein